MKIEKGGDGNLSISLDEKFDFSSVAEFRKLYESIEGVSKKTVTIDFKNTRYIDSSALGMLINIRNYFSKMDTKVKLCNTNDQIKKIFSISKFETKFDIS